MQTASAVARLEEETMDKTQVNPWSWQDTFGYSQAWRVDNAQSIVFLAGQVALSPDGQLVGEGDFDAQCRQVFENLGAVLEQAGATFDNVVKVTVYLPDITNLQAYRLVKAEFVHGAQPASTAIEVKGLAFPGLMVEVEAIAVL
jgi:reactive intermediate/imine deaminase